MSWPNQAWPNQFWPNQVPLVTITTRFNSAPARLFPILAVPGDLWFDSDTQKMYMAVVNPHQFFPDTTDVEYVTRVWLLGLSVKRIVRSALPAMASAGTIFLTTDSLESFAGTGLGVVPFRLSVDRALRGTPGPNLAGSPGRSPVAVYYVPFDS